MLCMVMHDSFLEARDTISNGECDRLLRGIAQGQAAAFEDFYRMTARSIYAYALSLTRNPQDAQDAMMDTYLSVRSHAKDYRSQGKPLAWVFTIARNAVRMQQRKLAREVPLEELPIERISIESDPDAAIALSEALRILSSEEREIVLLHAVSGLKHREIAQALSRPLSTVLSKYTRALMKLKRQLSAIYEEGDAL